MTSTSASFSASLAYFLGPSRVLTDPVSRAAYAVDDTIPAAVAKTASAEEVAEIVRFAALEKVALIPCGNRTKLGIGMPPTRYDIALDMTALNTIAHYDPGDLTLSVDAGLPVAKLNAALLEHKQFLPLLVPWYSRSTIGGTIASGIDSPLRQFYGTARDFLIGAEFVEGTGKLCKSGGRVVKNVTGYDLHKLLIGSLGTLAVITRLNFRTFPAPLASRGFVASFQNAAGALSLRRAIAESSLTPLTLDIVSPELARLFATRTPQTPEAAVFAGEKQSSDESFLPPIGHWFRPSEWQLCAAFSGTPEVLARYERDLMRLATNSSTISTKFLDDTSRPSLWGRLRESLSMLLEASPAAAIFKISIVPSRHAALFASLRQIAVRAALPHALVARAGGIVHFALLASTAKEAATAPLSPCIAQIFDVVSASSGHASLLFAPPSIKRSANVWGSPGSDLALMHASCAPDASAGRHLKSAFDAQNILAPGRFLGGVQ
jgi:glycolate oxidase FAD binding subunit